MALIFIYIMFLVIKFVVYFDYMLSIVEVVNMIMHRIIERSIKCSNWLSSQTCVGMELRQCFACGCTLHARMCGRPSRVTATRFSVIHLPYVGLVGPGHEGDSIFSYATL
jgi:hypothetical protein